MDRDLEGSHRVSPTPQTQSRETREKAKIEVPPPPLSGHKILLVDDSQFVLAALSEALAKEGLQIIKATAAKEAIKKLAAENDIELIVTDINMPDCNGLQFVAALRTLPRISSLPIVLFSGAPTTANREAAKKLNVACFVSKKAEDIIQAIKEILCPQT